MAEGGGLPGGFLFPLISGIATGIAGSVDTSRAKKREKELGARPVYSIPEPTLRNNYLAEERAQQGLSDEALQIYTQNADRGLSSSLDTLLKSGGGLNSIGDLYSNYNNNLAQLTLLDDQTKFANQQMLMNQNSIYANELDKAWQLNIFAPWADEKQAIAELRARGNAKTAAGVSMIANSVGGNNSFDNNPKKNNKGYYETQDSVYGMNEQQYDSYGRNSGYNYGRNGQDANLNYNYQNPNNSNYILESLYGDSYQNRLA